MFKQTVIRLHILALVVQRGHAPGSDAAANISRRIALVLTTMPVMAAFIGVVMLVYHDMNESYATLGLYAGVIICVFSVGAYTDYQFATNREAIEREASAIRGDLARGMAWAQRRLLGYVLLILGLTAAFVVAVRWVLILLEIVDGPLFRL